MEDGDHLIVTLSFLAVFFILQANFGLFNRFNFVTGCWDKWTGHERVVVYGEPQKADSLKAVIAPTLGFEYEKLTCIMTHSLVNGVEHYNYVMEEAINERLGEPWQEALNKEVVERMRNEK